MRYPLGQPVRVSTTVSDLSGAPAAPGSLVLAVKIRQADGTWLTTGTYGSAASDGTGDYHQDIPAADLSLTGHYQYAWTSTGAAAGVSYGEFDVFDPFELRVISLQGAKDMLDIPASDTASDAKLDRMIAAIESGLERFTGGPPVNRPFTERCELDGSLRVLLVRQRPLVSVTSITAVASGQPIDISGGLDVDSNSGVVRTALGWPFVGQFWANSPVVTVAGIAGWGTSVPAAFAEFAAIVVDHLWQPQRGPVAMPMGGVDTVTPPWLGFAIPNRALELLNGSQDGMAYAMEAYT